jgi:hypothetical protein
MTALTRDMAAIGPKGMSAFPTPKRPARGAAVPQEAWNRKALKELTALANALSRILRLVPAREYAVPYGQYFGRSHEADATSENPALEERLKKMLAPPESAKILQKQVWRHCRALLGMGYPLPKRWHFVFSKGTLGYFYESATRMGRDLGNVESTLKGITRRAQRLEGLC